MKQKNEALLIVHLSSLDAYTDLLGMDDGWNLAENITKSIILHNGPIIIIDQMWKLGPRPSEPRKFIYESIEEHQDRITYIKHDEDRDEWEELFDKLIPLLNQLKVTKVRLGGFWYDPGDDAGCAWYIHKILLNFVNVRVDLNIIGSTHDGIEQEDEEDDEESEENPRGMGHCYDWAYQQIKADESGESILVHGTVSDPLSIPPHSYEHAWVEKSGIVFDWQTMVAHHGGKHMGKGYPVEVFYELFQPKKMKRYSKEEAYEAMLKAVKKHGKLHYGPW